MLSLTCTATAPPPPPRLLDPQLATSYPSAILARERAIVVNLEFIKCIISMGGRRRAAGGEAIACCLLRTARGALAPPRLLMPIHSRWAPALLHTLGCLQSCAP